MMRGMLLIIALLLTGCRETNVPQEPTSWETQLNFAQTKARAVVPDVVLNRVMTFEFGFHPPRDAPSYKVFFDFLNEAGNIVTVSFVTNQMKETVHVSESNRIDPLPSEAEQQWREQVVSTIRVGPDEALERTRAAGDAFATGHEYVHVDLYLFITDSDKAQQARGAAAVWLVTYSEPLRGPDEETARLSVRVNAQTGAIID